MFNSPLIALPTALPENQPEARSRHWQLSMGALPIIGCFAAIFIAAVRPVTDNDVWWHLATGHYIVTHHMIPHADIFSWTAQGRAWVAHEWLTEVLFYGLWTHGGTAMMMLVFAAVIMMTFGVVYVSCRQQGVHPLVAMPITLLAAAASSHTWGTRPQMLSLLLLALYAAFLSNDGQPGFSARQWRATALPAGMILWVNLHGGFIFGLLLIGLIWIGDWLPIMGRTVAEIIIRSAPSSHAIITEPPVVPIPLAGARQKETGGIRTSPRTTRLPFMVVLASVLVTLINPQTWQALLYPFTYLGNNASMRYIAEWVSPDFHQGRYLFFEALLLILLLALALSPRRPRLSDVLLVVVFTYLALESVRNISLFAVILAPLAATHAQLVVSQWKDQVAVALGSSPIRPRWRSTIDRRRIVLHWIIAAGIVIAVSWIVQPLISNSTQARAVARTYPVGAVSYLKSHVPLSATTHRTLRLFNSYNWGGYLIWTLYPTYRVSIDGRPDMYGDAFVDQFVQTSAAGPGWLSRLKHVDVVVVEASSPLATALAQTPGWRRVYHDASAVIYQPWTT